VKPGVLVNAHAGCARRDPELPKRLGRLLPAEQVHTTGGAEDVAPALEALRQAGVDTLVLVGGDGTVSGTLSELLVRWPEDRLPAVVLVPGGTVNTIARSLGARGAPEELVARLLAQPAAAHESRRPLVSVRAGGVARAGMIFANGVAVRWLRAYYEGPRRGVAAAASLVARITASASVRGSFARRLFEALRCEVSVDGVRMRETRFTAMGASSVTHIGLGFAPFHFAGRNPDHFHFAVTDASAGQLAAALPALRLGRGDRLARLRHFAAQRVELRFEEPQPWSLDADVFDATRELELLATTPLRFLVP